MSLFVISTYDITTKNQIKTDLQEMYSYRNALL